MEAKEPRWNAGQQDDKESMEKKQSKYKQNLQVKAKVDTGLGPKKREYQLPMLGQEEPEGPSDQTLEDYFFLPTVNNNRMIVSKEDFLRQLRTNP